MISLDKSLLQKGEKVRKTIHKSLSIHQHSERHLKMAACGRIYA